MSVIGIDPSVGHPAFAVWPSGESARLQVEGRGAARLYELQIAAIEWLKHNAPNDLQGVFVERPIGNPRTTPIEVGHAAAVLQVAAIAALPVPCLELSPGEWKKTIGLKGNAPKADVGEWARALEITRDDLTEDEADALGIAAAGALLLEDPRPLTKQTTRGGDARAFALGDKEENER